MNNSPLQELQQWYFAHCDGAWEHGFGVKVETLDNPGWHLVIELRDTELESKPFEERRESYENEFGWMVCRKIGAQFDAAGGPEKLEDMIRVFLHWAASAA